MSLSILPQRACGGISLMTLVGPIVRGVQDPSRQSVHRQNGAVMYGVIYFSQKGSSSPAPREGAIDTHTHRGEWEIL